MNTDQLIEQLAKEARPVPRLLDPTRRATIWMVVALICVAAGVAHFGVRRDLADAWRMTGLVPRIVLLLSTMWLAVVMAFRQAVPGLETRVWRRLWPIGTLMVLVAIAAAEVTAALTVGEVGSPLRAWTCVRKVAFTGTVPALLALILIQRAAPVEPKWTALLGVLAAGAAGALTSELACPIRAPLHILLWHVLPVALSAGLGVLAGAALLAWTRRAISRRAAA